MRKYRCGLLEFCHSMLPAGSVPINQPPIRHETGLYTEPSASQRRSEPWGRNTRNSLSSPRCRRTSQDCPSSPIGRVGEFGTMGQANHLHIPCVSNDGRQTTVIRNMARGAAAVVGSFSLVLAACQASGANGSLTEIQADGGRVTGTSTPHGWVAHSAYGLQLSVPKAWAVAYFRDCPVCDTGTLLIGTPAYSSLCTEIPSDANILTMQPEQSEAVHATHVRPSWSMVAWSSPIQLAASSTGPSPPRASCLPQRGLSPPPC